MEDPLAVIGKIVPAFALPVDVLVPLAVAVSGGVTIVAAALPEEVAVPLAVAAAVRVNAAEPVEADVPLAVATSGKFVSICALAVLYPIVNDWDIVLTVAN